MSFADNLVYIRQHYGVTQEALAEQLGVSRQTISKWEAGINFPETDKLLALCDIYHTNLDDLMRGSIRIADERDTEIYDEHMNRLSITTALAVAIIITGTGVLTTLDALGFPDNVSTVAMLSFLVVGVVTGIIAGLNHSEFKRRHAAIDPVYSDAVLDRFGRRFTLMIAAGVGIVLLGIIFMVGLAPEHGDVIDLGFASFDEDLIAGPFMFLLAIAVGLFVYAGLQKSKYNRSEITYIADGSSPKTPGPRVKTPEELKRDHIIGSLCGIIMILAVIVFLVGGFLPSFDQFAQGGMDKFEIKNFIKGLNGGFAVSWLAFPVGGLLCGVVAIIVSMVHKSSDEIIAEARKEDPWIKVESGGAEQTQNTAAGTGEERNPNRPIR